MINTDSESSNMTGNESHTHDVSIINVPINIIRNNSNGSLSIGCRKGLKKSLISFFIIGNPVRLFI